MTKTREFIGFESYQGRSAYLYAYDGFDWASINEVGASVVDQVCDTGYNNVLHGQDEGFTSPFEDGYGIFMSENLRETFNLQSMIAASAWCGKETFTFISYVYQHGRFQEKAADTITLYQTASKIDFRNYGTDFAHISAVTIVSNKGTVAGSSCTYGHPTYGYQMAFDNMKVVFNGPIPKGGHGHKSVLLPVQLAHHHDMVATPWAPFTHEAGSNHAPGWTHAADSGDITSNLTSGNYHSMLLSLPSPSHPALVDEFVLPVADHFGT